MIEAGDATFTVDFHPRLTVMAGLGRLEREGLVNELVGALGSNRSGTHLEMVSDAGNRFAIFRPQGARHRVVDIDNARDVTDGFQAPDGSIDLLRRAGLGVSDAKRRLRITAEDLTTTTEAERLVGALAQVDQHRLWELADEVRVREDTLAELAQEMGSAPEDADVVARIEERHREFEAAEEANERVRSVTLWAAFIAMVVAIPIVMVSPVFLLPLVAVAVASGAVSLLTFRRMQQARAAEEDALREAGAPSYLTFHLQRVNGLLGNDSGRARMMKAAEEHRAALAQWHLLAGETTIDWALEHRAEIRAVARQLDTTNRLGRVAPAAPPTEPTTAEDLALTLASHLDAVRRLGPGGETFPALLDDPLVDVTSNDKAALLEAVARASRSQQIIFLTNDDEVAEWARVEALTGDLALIEPPARGEAEAPPARPRRAGRHVAA